MEFVVDFMYFKKSANILVVKELCVIPLIDAQIPHVSVLFKPPSGWRRQLKSEKKVNRQLMKFHKIRWNSGYASSKDIIKILNLNLKNATKIYVKGSTKKDYIEQILFDK